MELKVSLYPEKFYILGVNVGLSVVMAYAVTGVLVAALLLLRLRVRRFREVPVGLQNAMEAAVEGVHRFAEVRIGHYADFVAPVTMTFMCYVFFNTVVELFGLPPATEDLNCTVALGLCSFLMVNVTALKFLGLKGRVKGLARPMAAVLPIKVVTDCIAPFSMGIRLFSNVLVGGVIMQLIYKVVPIVLPAIVASYFNILHVGIQTFVFSLLSLIYIGEAVE